MIAAELSEHDVRRAKRGEKRLEAFQSSLPSIYRYFEPAKSPNLALVDHLRKWWWATLDWSTSTDTYSPDEDSRCIGCDSGLLLFGPARCGKTFTACELARRVITSQNCGDARFIQMVEWSAECSRRAKDCELEGWAHDIVSSVWDGDPGVLVLDDLDKVRATDTVQSALFNLIETAVSNDVKLIVTTNCTAEQLAKRFKPEFGQPIAGRLRDFCVPVNFGVKMTP